MTIASSLFSFAKTLRPSPKTAAVLAAAPLFVALTGCADEDQSGTLTINYQFGAGAASCADSDAVQTVRVTLDGMQFAEEACDDSGSISLPSVPAKNYGMLLVEGVDAEGTTVRDNLAPPAEDESVEVVGGSAVVKDVRLTPTPATVRYQFILLDENELPYAPAATIPIKEFRTEAFRQGGNLLLLGHTFIVDQLDTFLVDMPDPDRSIVGTDLDFVAVGIVDQNDALVSSQTVTFTPPGAGKLVLVRVRCLGTNCTAEEEIMGGEIDPTGGDTDTGGATSG